jgi:hypothetical protein
MDNRLLDFTRLALAVARRVVPARWSKFATHNYAPASRLGCLLPKEHLRLD